ncbi:class I SAM-dependent methyltransferase [Planctomycetota bacterium]|nr:class I SAM-dependent methyltransferase [Planctomycetota bacterium]
MNTDITTNTESQSFWDDEYKIPWHEADFSRRMLNEHLTQEHDLASRRFEIIDRQIEWIEKSILTHAPSNILDLGCGPGLYAQRLTAKGYEVLGIDFSPASIDYAKEQNQWPERCIFRLGDIRSFDYEKDHDLAMLLYGELNVFSPSEAEMILRKANASLKPGGRLIVEFQTHEAIQKNGENESIEQQCEKGLFSDQPYTCCIDSSWFPKDQITVQYFRVIEHHNEKTRTYVNTQQAYYDQALIELLQNAGFSDIGQESSWPCENDGFQLWSAVLP